MRSKRGASWLSALAYVRLCIQRGQLVSARYATVHDWLDRVALQSLVSYAGGTELRLTKLIASYLIQDIQPFAVNNRPAYVRKPA